LGGWDLAELQMEALTVKRRLFLKHGVIAPALGLVNSWPAKSGIPVSGGAKTITSLPSDSEGGRYHPGRIQNEYSLFLPGEREALRNSPRASQDQAGLVKAGLGSDRRIKMAYIVRFVQRYLPERRAAFMKVEAKFAAMEQRRNDFPKGRRCQPYAGREPSNTLIWESEFPSLAEAQAALSRISADAEHGALFREQEPYMTESYTEINEVLDFCRG
jgi:hypothetical protein